MIYKVNKIILGLLIFCFSCNSVKYRSLNHINQIIEYGKIWGFLKYYHPNVARGIIDWDSVFITQVKRLQSIKNIHEYNLEIDEIIRTAGESDYFSDSIMIFTDIQKINYDFTWLEKSQTINKGIKTKLLSIRDYHKPINNYYVQKISSGGNPSFENENTYEEMVFPSKEFRLLSLFRYWNVINYYYPYKYLTDENWDLIPKKLFNKFSLAKDTLHYHLAIRELAAQLDDTHGYIMNTYVPEKLGYYYFPVGFGYIKNQTFVSEIYHDSLAKQNNLKLGDLITKINDMPIQYLRDSIQRYIAASNESGKNQEINIYLSMLPKGIIKLDIIRDGKNMVINSQNYYEFYRTSIRKQNQKKWKIIDDNIGYINMEKVEKRDVDLIMKKLFNTDAIIFDIRNYPNDTDYLFSQYLNKSKMPCFKPLYPNYDYPGTFYFGDIGMAGPETTNNNYYKGQVIILINESTISHAEFSTMVLQTSLNSIIVGSQSAGADGNSSILYLPGNIEVRFTGIGIYYPDGTQTQRIGIQPDVLISPTINGIKNGRDEVLEKAINIAKENNKVIDNKF